MMKWLGTENFLILEKKYLVLGLLSATILVKYQTSLYNYSSAQPQPHPQI